MASDEQTRKLAYAIWEEAGRPQEKDTQIYFRAKEILESLEGRPSLAHELELQYNRFNFFLVSTVILVMAFVLLATSASGLPTDVTWLGQSMAALGTVLSFVFLVMNYISAEAIHCIRNGQPIDPVTSIGRLPKDVLSFLASPLAFSKRKSASHTWFVPAVFCLFWAAAWWIMFSWIGPVVTVLFVATVSFTYGLIGRVRSSEYSREPRQIPVAPTGRDFQSLTPQLLLPTRGYAVVRRIAQKAATGLSDRARQSFLWFFPKKAPQASTVKET